MPCSSPLSTPPPSDSDDEDIPELVPNVSAVHKLYPPNQSPSDEEADKEVAQICKVPVYYRLCSLRSCHSRYYTNDSLDTIDEWLHKRYCQASPVEVA